MFDRCRDKDETEHDQDANLVRAELADLPQDSVNIQRHFESDTGVCGKEACDHR